MVVALIKADRKSDEIAELSAKIELLQQNAAGSTDNTTSTQTPNTTLSLSEQLKEAYKNKTGKDYSFNDVTSAAIKNSAVSPYQTIEATVVIDLGGSYTSNMALFYRTSPDAEWQYFTNTTGVLSCSDYSTDDLKKAYAGETCTVEGNATSNGGYSTVQP